MSRTHLFAVVVLLGAAAFAGVLALTRTGQVGATPEPASSAQLAAKTRSLDRLEASLRRSLAARTPSQRAAQETPSQRTVYVRAASPQTPAGEHDDEHGDEHGDDDHGQGHDGADD
jgi:hypothetical protein